MLLKFVSKIKNSILIIKNIKQINKDKPKVIFFSEGESYFKYSYLLLNTVAKNYPNQVYYVSTEINDKIDNKNIKNIFIGNGLLMQFFFLTVKGDNMFMTLTDLNNNIVKKNNFIKNYVYFFHGAVSTTKVYTKGAFDNYDKILCNGKYHLDEIKFREKLLNLKQKDLIQSGYSYFDYLNQKINKSVIPDEILIAPSWNKDKENFINEKFELIIERLIVDGFKVRFRPHPENLKRSEKYLNKIRKKFSGEEFIFDVKTENYHALEKAKCLITDTSGIAIEYLFLMKRPVIYFDNFDKVHNDEIDNYKELETIENKIKSLFGSFFNENQIKDLKKNIEVVLNNFYEKNIEIDNFIHENFFNYNKTEIFLEKNLSSILK